jgi:hypothetical protein
LSDLADRIAPGCRPDKPAILIIDGARDLAPRALPELCSVGGLTGSTIHPVQILLSGLDQVWELLDRTDHASYGDLAGQSLRKGNRAEARRFASRGLALEPTDRDFWPSNAKRDRV